MEHDTRFTERKSDPPHGTRNRYALKSRLGGDHRAEGPSRVKPAGPSRGSNEKSASRYSISA